MADLGKQRVAYEDMAEKALVAIRVKEKLQAEVSGLKMKVTEMQPAFQELSLVKIKAQYLGQQSTMFSEEVAELRDKEKGLVMERNLLRRKLKIRDGELSFLQVDFANFRGLTDEEKGGTRAELISVKAENETLRKAIEDLSKVRRGQSFR